jgi:hypothetical protein
MRQTLAWLIYNMPMFESLAKTPCIGLDYDSPILKGIFKNQEGDILLTTQTSEWGLVNCTHILY